METATEAAATTATSKIATWKMHRKQHDAFNSVARTIVLVSGRRWGKSETACMWSLAGAHNDRLKKQAGITWWISPTYDLARPIWRKMLRIAPAGWITRTVGSETQPDSLHLGDSRIEFKSADHPERLVAEGLKRVVIDECGIVKESVWTESIMPALMDFRAPAFLCGTPKGRNWFYRLWLRGRDPLDEEVKSYGGPSRENPFIAESEIDRLAAEMPQRLYRQEILAEFLSDEGAVFRGVRDCLGPYSKQATAALGVDLAKHVDFTVIVGMDSDRRMTSFDRFREVSWPLQKRRIIAAAKPGTKVLLDSTGVGDPILDDLVAAGIDVEGYKFTNPSKQQLVEGLAIGIEQREVGLADEPVMINELEAFEYDVSPSGVLRYGAPGKLGKNRDKGTNEKTAHDDCVMALALAYRAVSLDVYDLSVLNRA